MSETTAPRSYDATDLASAVAILVEEARIEADDTSTPAIARLLGCERPALRWAGQLARTLGWAPLHHRLADWALAPLLGASSLPWRDDVERAVSDLEPRDVELLATFATCDGRFSWDVLEAVAPDASVDAVCRLEDAGLLVRSARAGVVIFGVPFCVRAVHHVKDPEATRTHGRRWAEAWRARADALRGATYGPSARATLSELAAAVPLAERAVLHARDAANATDAGLALALWVGVSEAMFFEGAVDYSSDAFVQAVALADAQEPSQLRIKSRLIAARASLETAAPERAAALVAEAARLSSAAGHDDLRAEVQRGAGWAALASARLDDARASLEEARALSLRARDPRGQADATAGLGVLALLSGATDEARELLSEALATHVVTRDAPREAAVRAMTELLPGSPEAIDVARARARVDELRGTGQRWREALALGQLMLAEQARGNVDAAHQHLREARAAATLASMSAATLVETLVETRRADGRAGDPSTPRPEVRVGHEGRTLEVHPGGEVLDLSRHGPLRRMLWVLASATRTNPGAALTTLALVDAAWPGERMKHEAATLRVYTTIRRLRAMGLADALVTRDDGYLFDPSIAVVLEGGS